MVSFPVNKRGRAFATPLSLRLMGYRLNDAFLRLLFVAIRPIVPMGDQGLPVYGIPSGTSAVFRHGLRRGVFLMTQSMRQLSASHFPSKSRWAATLKPTWLYSASLLLSCWREHFIAPQMTPSASIACATRTKPAIFAPST